MPHRFPRPTSSKRLDLDFYPQLELAKLVDQTPGGPGWLHEIKYDGYRILAHVQGGRVQLRSRSDLDWTERFLEVASVIEKLSEKLSIDSAVLDGEIVVLNKSGLSSFSALQNHLSEKAKKGFIYYVFDLLYLNGVDLREAPLLARKKLLQALLRSKVRSAKNAPVQFAPHQLAQGDQVYQSACRHELEGIISKRIDSPYLSGRSNDWVKSKCRREEEFVIGGFTDPGGSRLGFGALLLGYWKGDRFVYAGRVGTGFNSKTLGQIFKLLKKTEVFSSPFVTELSREERKGAHYVKPIYVAQIKYTEWTADRHLRHPVFLGLREDKPGSEVNRAA